MHFFQCFFELHAVDIRHKMHTQARMAKRLERRAHHQRAQIGAANANVHHIGNHLIGVTQPLAAAHSVGKAPHALEHGVYFGHHVFAVYFNRRIGAVAQRHMQHGAVFGGVDFVAVKHLLDAFRQPGFARQIHQQRQGFIGDAVFAVVEHNAAHFQPIALGTARVFGKQITHVHVLGLLKMLP